MASASAELFVGLDVVLRSYYSDRVRIERAIDAFLDWRRLERDATPRSVDSYRRILDKLAEDYPELDLSSFTKHDLRAFLKRWQARSSATRANMCPAALLLRVGVAEDLIEIDPSAPLRRPKKRRADIYRPSIGELAAVRAAALASELPAILLMEGVGLRRGEVLRVRWADIDLIRGRVRVFRKGHRQPLPLAPDVLDGLRGSFRAFGRSSMTMCSRLRSSSGSRRSSASASERIRRFRRASNRYANGSARLPARRHPGTFPAPVASWLRKSLPSRERARCRCASARSWGTGDRHDTAVHG